MTSAATALSLAERLGDKNLIRLIKQRIKELES